MAHTSQETQQNIIRYFFKNKNNSCAEIAEVFDVKEATVNEILNRGFIRREIFEIYESKMNY